MDNLLLDVEVTLQKMQMKGGWTFALLPTLQTGTPGKFGWKKFNAEIDGYLMSNVSLMPIKQGLFLAVKAQVRKAIGKEAGDKVHIKLYAIAPVISVAHTDFLEALSDAPDALNHFNKLPAHTRELWTSWVFEHADPETTVSRMAQAINDLSIGAKFKHNTPARSTSHDQP